MTVNTQAVIQQPSVSIARTPASVSEDGATNFTYTVTRSLNLASPTVVNITASGTATSGSDYTGAPGTVTIPAGATTATFVIDPAVDGTVEADETVTMTVASGTGYTVGAPASATGTILNDDVPSATISVSPASVAEDGAPNLIYTVTLNQASFSAISVNYTIGGTAANGTDYATIASPLVIPAGNTTGTVTVNPTADTTIEADESVTLTLAAGTGYTVGVPNSATGTILNDDLPNLTINDVTLSEGNSGTTNFIFTVSLSAPAGPGGVTFNIATANGSATAGTDYVAQSLTSQTIPAGSSTYNFTVQVSGDTLNEPGETFFVNVTGVTNAIVVDGQGVGTINNDDPLPSLSIDDVTVVEGNAGAVNSVFTVTLSTASGQTVTVNYATADGTAAQPADYTNTSGTLTFTPGQTTRTITVPVIGETVPEANETFFVNLSGATSATISDNQGVGTITNDDVPVTVSPGTVPSGTVAAAYSQTLTASGGVGPYSFAVTAGALPAGLTLSSGGVLSGTPTAGGSFNFTITATDSSAFPGPYTGSQAYTLTVAAIVSDAPSIGTATAGDTQATVTFTAPVNDGGAAITGYTVTANPGGATGTGANSPITVTGLTNGVTYTFTVTATNSVGTGTASAASNAVTPAAPQTITFNNPGAQNYGTSPDLSVLGGGASSTSGLAVTFTSSTTGVCTVTSGGLLTFISAGTCTINADQAGNAAFLPASQVSRSFNVNAVVPDAPTSVVATPGDTQASVAFVAPVEIGGSAITGYTVTVSPADVAPVNGASSPIVVTGLTNGQSYTFTVTADNVAGTGPASSPSNAVTPKAIQTITFNNPGSQNFGTSPTLTATSDSGLTPTFTSSTPGVCTVTSGGLLTFVSAGTCTISADQSGNNAFMPATQVTRSFAVNAVLPGAPTIGVATAGNTEATVTFTPPAFTGGEAISGYVVTASPGGATALGAGSPITITGLTNETSYTFTVAAVNTAGTGSPSAPSNAVIPTAPMNLDDLSGATGNERYGTAITAADMNADGFDDLIVGSPYRAVVLGANTKTKVGVIEIFSGQDGTLLNTLNGTASKQRFGTALAAIADQNSDGVPDLVVGNPYANGGRGNVSLYSGADGGLLQSLADGEGNAGSAGCPPPIHKPVCDLLGIGETTEGFGAAVAVGDVDNDGDDDLIVGAPKADVSNPAKRSMAGRVVVFDGLSSTPLYSRTGMQSGENFGASVAFNAADGQLLVGSSHFDVLVPKRLANAGQVQVFDASNGSSPALVTVTGSAAKEYFGSAVGSFDGDIDGDTATDWVVGVPGALVGSDKMGKVHMFSGAATVPFASREGVNAKGYFGKALCANGDLNADATNDLVIGAPRESVQGPSGKAMPKTGVVRVYSGAKLP